MKIPAKTNGKGAINKVSSVGFSNKWNSKEAGKEVILEALTNLGGNKPDFVLLFCTIHYSKKEFGGLQNLLDAIHKELPAETQVIGGTVAGFIIPQGCYTRGVTAMAINASDMDVSIATTENIKKDPKKSAIICATKIKKELSKSKYPNKFLLNLPSGITTPKIPGFPDNLRVIRSKSLSKIMLAGLNISLKIRQKGPGRESLIIETLGEELPDYQMIGGSFIDNNKGYANYQFYDRKVYTNMLITVGISTKYPVKVNSTFGLKETNKKFKITQTSTYDLLIEKINNKPALDEMVSILNWPSKFLEDSATILKKTFYNPIGYKVNGKQYISVMAFIFGDKIMVSPKVKCEDACIMTTSGQELIKSVLDNLSKTKGNNMRFGLITSCIARLETLGAHVFEIHKILMNHFKGVPFVQIYTVGEDVCTKELGAKRIAESYNTAIFLEK